MSNINNKYKGIIRKSAIAASMSGVIPFSDIVIMSGIWGTMIVSIAARAGHPLSMERATKLATALFTGVLAFKAATKVLTAILHFFPGIGTITALGIDSFINAFQTYRLGRQFAKELDQADFNMDHVMELAGGIIETVVDMRPDHVLSDSWEVIGCLTGT